MSRLKMGETDKSLQSDLGDLVPQIVEKLTSGQHVCLCFESSCALLTSALATSKAWDESVGEQNKNCVLLVRDVASARDFLDEVSPVIKRLMGKCWPGQFRLVFCSGVDQSLISHLAPCVQRSVQTVRGLSLCVPGLRILQKVLEQVPFPLIQVELDKNALIAQTGLTIPVSTSQSTVHEAEIHIDGDRWKLVKSCGLTEAHFERMMTSHYLFVCTGNTCRSPMAAAMFRQLLARRLKCDETSLGEHGFTVSSAGLAAGVGAPASPESVEICRNDGVDLTHHSSQPLTEELLLAADKVFTMTFGHRETILSQYPELEDRIELLSRNGQDVSDPIGWGMAAYQQCHREIFESLQALVDELTN
ncbi:MAG: hypothetical protein R3C02_15940 [Planctomycetaceae bacterium]